MNSEILEKAEELGYEIVETTSDGNGYPSNLLLCRAVYTREEKKE